MSKLLKKLFRTKSSFLLPVVIVMLVFGYGAAYYFHDKYSALKENPNIEAQKEADALVKEISQFMELPEETPTIATVLNKNDLKDQPFFNNAENGDKLLAFTKSMKAVLYRPETKKIIEVAPIVINASDINIPEKEIVQ